jgi:hypothetical protein
LFSVPRGGDPSQLKVLISLMLYYLSQDSVIIEFWRKQGRFGMFLDKDRCDIDDDRSKLMSEGEGGGEGCVTGKKGANNPSPPSSNPIVLVLDEGTLSSNSLCL